jgi:hypothetical protein
MGTEMLSSLGYGTPMGTTFNEGRNVIEETRESEVASKDATSILAISWGIALVPIFLLLTLIPYFSSPYVLFTHNPGDEAIVSYLGEGNVKPFLLVLLLIGGGLGLVTSRFTTSLFQDTKLNGCVAMKGVGKWSRLFLPWFGLVSYPIYQILIHVVPAHPWDWGALSTMLFTFPGFGFVLSASAMFLITYTRVNNETKKRGLKIQMVYTPRKRGSYQIRLSDMQNGIRSDNW